MKTALLFLSLTLPATALAGDVSTMPRDRQKEAWVRHVLARFSLNNPMRVVRDDALTGTDTCAYATIRKGVQYIAYAPDCLAGPLPLPPKPGDAGSAFSYPWPTAAVMAHEIAHHILGHTAHNRATTVADQLAAEQWAGSALRHLGASLDDALAFARRTPERRRGGFPGRAEAVNAITKGWLEAEALRAGEPADFVLPPPAMPPSPWPLRVVVVLGLAGLMILGWWGRGKTWARPPIPAWSAPYRATARHPRYAPLSARAPSITRPVSLAAVYGHYPRTYRR